MIPSISSDFCSDCIYQLRDKHSNCGDSILAKFNNQRSYSICFDRALITVHGAVPLELQFLDTVLDKNNSKRCTCCTAKYSTNQAAQNWWHDLGHSASPNLLQIMNCHYQQIPICEQKCAALQILTCVLLGLVLVGLIQQGRMCIPQPIFCHTIALVRWT